jgi:hypothetical protein
MVHAGCRSSVCWQSAGRARLHWRCIFRRRSRPQPPRHAATQCYGTCRQSRASTRAVRSRLRCCTRRAWCPTSGAPCPRTARPWRRPPSTASRLLAASSTAPHTLRPGALCSRPSTPSTRCATSRSAWCAPPHMACMHAQPGVTRARAAGRGQRVCATRRGGLHADARHACGPTARRRGRAAAGGAQRVELGRAARAHCARV